MKIDFKTKIRDIEGTIMLEPKRDATNNVKFSSEELTFRSVAEANRNGFANAYESEGKIWNPIPEMIEIDLRKIVVSALTREWAEEKEKIDSEALFARWNLANRIVEACEDSTKMGILDLDLETRQRIVAATDHWGDAGGVRVYFARARELLDTAKADEPGPKSKTKAAA